MPEIAKAFERTNDQQLMLLLIEMKYEGAFELILKLLESNEPATRLTGIQEMGKLGDKRAIPYLVSQLNTMTLRPFRVKPYRRSANWERQKQFLACSTC